MPTTDIALAGNGALATMPAPTKYAMAVEELTGQVKLIQQVMTAVMKEKEHYGKIPGCGDKPTLLKPGAEKLAIAFRFAPKYDIEERERDNNHREYRVICSLYSIITGAFVGQGVGVATTMEGKWRFRTGEGESTGVRVPKSFWDTRDQAILKKLANEAGFEGEKFNTKKIDGQWMITTHGERIEHDNPADYYNTVAKMAKKRALVDAVLTATAASDCFTQDIEDMPQADAEPSQDSQPQQATKAPQGKQQQASQKQIGLLHNVAQNAGFDEQGLLEAARRFLKAGDLNDITQLWTKEASSLIDAIKSGNLKPESPMDRMDPMPGDDEPMDPATASFLAAEEAREAANA